MLPTATSSLSEVSTTFKLARAMSCDCYVDPQLRR